LIDRDGITDKNCGGKGKEKEEDIFGKLYLFETTYLMWKNKVRDLGPFSFLKQSRSEEKTFTQ
jgi:hypothetical protein